MGSEMCIRDSSISDGSVAIFPLPKFRFVGCANCHNLSHVHITCSLKVACMAKKSYTENTQREEVNAMITSPQTTKTPKPEAVSISTGKSSYLSFSVGQ